MAESSPSKRLFPEKSVSYDEYLQQIEEAARPLERITSEDYFRGRQAQAAQKNQEKVPLSKHTVYAIDKSVRKRMKKGWFGFDHSQFYAVEFEINEPFIRNTNELKGEEGKVEERKQFPTMLLKKLASHRRIDKKLSYEDWKRKKASETRLRQKLEIEALRKEYFTKIEEQTVNSQLREQEKNKKVRSWLRRKSREKQKKKKQEKEKKLQEENNKILKDEKAAQAFREWLKKDFIRIKSEKRKQLISKETEMLKLKRKETETIQRQIRSRQAVQSWKKNKRSQSKQNNNQPAKVFKPKRPKPVMLAYSPNRPKHQKVKAKIEDIIKVQNSVSNIRRSQNISKKREISRYQQNSETPFDSYNAEDVSSGYSSDFVDTSRDYSLY